MLINYEMVGHGMLHLYIKDRLDPEGCVHRVWDVNGDHYWTARPYGKDNDRVFKGKTRHEAAKKVIIFLNMKLREV